MATRKPASVLPEPVGAAISVSWPRAISCQPRAWASVGPSGKRWANHLATAGWKASGGSGGFIASGHDTSFEHAFGARPLEGRPLAGFRLRRDYLAVAVAAFEGSPNGGSACGGIPRGRGGGSRRGGP